MRHFKNRIHVREEFYYEVLLPFLGSKGWRYEISTEDEEMHVTLNGLTDDKGKEQSVAAARKLIYNLQKGARLAPFYVYSYEGTYDERLDGGWRIDASPGIEEATELAVRLSDMQHMGTVRIYVSTEYRPKWRGEEKGHRPYKVRAIQLQGYFEIRVWEADFSEYEAASHELKSLLGDMEAVGAVYVCIAEWRSVHGTDRG